MKNTVWVLCALLISSSCNDSPNYNYCPDEVGSSFLSVQPEPISELTLAGIQITTEKEHVSGYREGGVTGLLLVDALLSVVPPCDATTLELELDDHQWPLKVNGYGAPSSGEPMVSRSSRDATAPERVELDYPFVRWTIRAPTGVFRRVELDSQGSTSRSVVISRVAFY